MYQVWRDSDLVQRVPIIVTGNDFSTLFAPLVRDGRMTKFYWEPDQADLLSICHQMYKVLPSHAGTPFPQLQPGIRILAYGISLYNRCIWHS